MPSVVMPSPFAETAKVGLPAGSRRSGIRTDFDPQEFVFEIETKGARFAWLRAAECPCTPINDQTDQTDPSCPICRRRGVFYFGPSNYTVDKSTVGELDAVQKKALGEGAVIRGVFSSVTYREPLDHKLGRVILGDTMVTVRPENRLGQLDRLVCLDALVIYREIVEIDADGAVPVARYPIVNLNLVAMLTDGGTKVKRLGAESFALVDGEIRWRPEAAMRKGTRVSLHYQCHPTYKVIEHPNVFRVSLAAFKRPPRQLQTPLGDVVELPLRAKVMLEFQPHEE